MVVISKIVPQEEWSAAGLGEDHIHVAIAVDISKGRTAANHRLEKVSACFVLRHRDKRFASVNAGVPEKLGGLRVLLARLHFPDLLFEVSVRGEEIEPAVEIVVEEENPELQKESAGGADPFGYRFVGKGER